MPLEPCEKRPARVSSTALVRYRSNDYSVPMAYGFRDVMVKGFVDEVVILCAGQEIARHPRSYDSADFVFDPLHYLALIERSGALDQAAPLTGLGSAGGVPAPAPSSGGAHGQPRPAQTGVGIRPLSFYDAVARRLASESVAR